MARKNLVLSLFLFDYSLDTYHAFRHSLLSKIYIATVYFLRERLEAISKTGSWFNTVSQHHI